MFPHCSDSDAPHVQCASPILLTALVPLTQGFDASVLVNLGAEVPQGFERFERVIEVVTAFAPEVSQARVRWKAYKAAGQEPYAHDLDQIRSPQSLNPLGDRCVANRAFHRLILAGANPYSAALSPVLLRTR